MSDTAYVTLGRQAGLLREFDLIAQNVAHANTTGYRAAGLVFHEHVVRDPAAGPSLSMAGASARRTETTQGALERTGGTLDLAIEGPGYFMIEGGADGGGAPELTRAGAFVARADGTLVTADGRAVLDAGGAPVVLPAAGRARIAPDGTVSGPDGPAGQLALVQPTDPSAMRRTGGTRFAADETEPVEAPRIVQGFLEASNVDPVVQMARLVEVQNAYQMGQTFLEREDERLRGLSRLLDRA